MNNFYSIIHSTQCSFHTSVPFHKKKTIQWVKTTAIYKEQNVQNLINKLSLALQTLHIFSCKKKCLRNLHLYTLPRGTSLSLKWKLLFPNVSKQQHKWMRPCVGVYRWLAKIYYIYHDTKLNVQNLHVVSICEMDENDSLKREYKHFYPPDTGYFHLFFYNTYLLYCFF